MSMKLRNFLIWTAVIITFLCGSVVVIGVGAYIFGENGMRANLDQPESPNPIAIFQGNKEEGAVNSQGNDSENGEQAEEAETPESGLAPTNLPEDHFVTKGVPGCVEVNPDSWKKEFGKDGVYVVNPRDNFFTKGHTYWVEGVITGTDPIHSVFELTKKVTLDQANIWDCGLRAEASDEELHTLAFEFVDKKYVDQTIQNLSKPYHVVTPFGTYDYEDGEKPAWAPTVPDTLSPTCPYKVPTLSIPAGVQTENGYVGAPGKAGCDFVVVSPDGKSAKRYHGAIDSFPYFNGSVFYLFDPSLSNFAVSDGIPSHPEVTNSWK